MGVCVHRTPEPELMDADEQAEAYASADFEDAHSRLIRLFRVVHQHRVACTHEAVPLETTEVSHG